MQINCHVLVSDRLPKTWVSSTWNQSKRQVKQGISYFSPNLMIFSKFCSNFSVLHFIKIIKYSKNLVKNEEKPCSICLQPISPRNYRYPNPGFCISVTRSTTTYKYVHKIGSILFLQCRKRNFNI